MKVAFGVIVCALALVSSTIITLAQDSNTVSSASRTGYQQFNLVGNQVPAHIHEKLLVNPWGLAFGPKTFIWVSDNNSGTSTLYGPNGKKESLVVTIPPPSGSTAPATPTGIVFNLDPSNFGGAYFIFATEDGTISEWDGSIETKGLLKVDNPNFNSGTDPVYKGLAIAPMGSTPLLLRGELQERKDRRLRYQFSADLGLG